VKGHVFHLEQSQSSNNKHVSNTLQLSHSDWNLFLLDIWNIGLFSHFSGRGNL